MGFGKTLKKNLNQVSSLPKDKLLLESDPGKIPESKRSERKVKITVTTSLYAKNFTNVLLTENNE